MRPPLRPRSENTGAWHADHPGPLALNRKYEAGAIDDACDRAWRSRGFRYRIVKNSTERRAATSSRDLKSSMRIPWDLTDFDYAEFVRHAIQKDKSCQPHCYRL